MKRLLLLPALLLVACGHDKAPEKNAALPAPSFSVKTLRPETAEWSTLQQAIGTVRARTTGTVSAKVMATVREVHVNIGDTVRSGQTLLLLDSSTFDSAVQQAEAARREASDARPEIEAAVAAAQAQLDLAQATFNRMKDLFEKKSISNQEFDEASARLQMAKANLAMTQSKRQQLRSKIAQANEEVKRASLVKGYTVVTAPFAGVVTEKRVEPGNVASPGVPLLFIEQAGAYRLEVPVDEAMLPKLRRGQPVEVAIEALDRTFHAPVSEIVPTVDAASRSVIVKINLPSMPNLRSGLSGRIRLPGDSRRILTLPAAAVHAQGSLRLVYVATQGVAQTRLVTTGEQRDGAIEILSGIGQDDRVIHPIPPMLVDGSKVEVGQ